MISNGPTCRKCGDWLETHDGKPVCKSGCAQSTWRGAMRVTITINVDDDDRRAVSADQGHDGLATPEQMRDFLLMVAECELENLVRESEAAEGGE